jgi:hypothetical protein
VCELQLMVLSRPHRIDDLLRQAFNKAVMEFEMVQKLSFRQERRIASFAPTDGATEVTHFIRCPSVLAEHVMYNVLGGGGNLYNHLWPQASNVARGKSYRAGAERLQHAPTIYPSS